MDKIWLGYQRFFFKAEMKTATHKDTLDDAWKIECISTSRWKQRVLNDGLFLLYLLLWMPTSKGWWVLMCTKSSVRACGDSTLIWLESPSSFVCTFYRQTGGWWGIPMALFRWIRKANTRSIFEHHPTASQCFQDRFLWMNSCPSLREHLDQSCIHERHTWTPSSQ